MLTIDITLSSPVVNEHEALAPKRPQGGTHIFSVLDTDL
jgi:hypothetical protein